MTVVQVSKRLLLSVKTHSPTESLHSTLQTKITTQRINSLALAHKLSTEPNDAFRVICQTEMRRERVLVFLLKTVIIS